MKCSSKFFTYELSRTNVMLAGLACAWREMKGPVATVATPAVSFRKSRRVVCDCAGCAIHSPLVCDVDGLWKYRARSHHAAPCSGQPSRERAWGSCRFTDPG